MSALPLASENTGAENTGAGSTVPERIVARLRPHARALFWPSVALILDCATAGYLWDRLPARWGALTLGNTAVLVGAGLLAALLWLAPMLAWLGRNYTLTTRRIIVRSGLLVRVRQELLHSRGYDVTVRKNALQAAFGSGNVEVNSGLDRPVVLRDVPRADLVQSALHDLMEASLNSVAAHRQQHAAGAADETTFWGTR